MLETPSRQGLAALAAATNRITNYETIGFMRAIEETRASIFYAYPLGIGEFIIPMSEVPDILSPAGDGARQVGAELFYKNQDGAVEWLLNMGQVKRVVSLPVPKHEPGTRFWLGLKDPAALTSDQLVRLNSVAESSAD